MGKGGGEKMERSRAELDRVSYLTIGAAIEVHRILGPGLLESIYEEALCVELASRKLPFARQVPAKVMYKQHSIGEVRLDLVVCDRVVLELKATDGIAPIHVAQLLSYLKATRLRLGLLINFNVPELRHGIKRLVLDA
jgi:GxxExxY protein